ncbi:MAG: hypothetical protein KGY99_05025 [Phycisphaerae bacterium]|nr:hypothetical protein [Phycisphaerae bacterium]
MFNFYEAWVHQLGWTDCDLDVIADLPGRAVGGWDERIRPVPANARLISLNEALCAQGRYDCVVAHNVRDVFTSRNSPPPRLLVLHSALEGRAREEGATVSTASSRIGPACITSTSGGKKRVSRGPAPRRRRVQHIRHKRGAFAGRRDESYRLSGHKKGAKRDHLCVHTFAA